MLTPFLTVTQTLTSNIVSEFFVMFNTLTTELLFLNFNGLHYATFSVVMHCAEFVHLTAPRYAGVSIISAYDGQL